MELQPLRDLGLSEIESLVYSYLVGKESTTGYKISHAIGKPTANTYKAIASLERMGAVLVDEGENRRVQAVAPAELLKQLERRFQRSRRQAADVLEKLAPTETEEGVYTLRDVDQVLETARSLLDRGERIVLLDIFPAILQELAGDLERTVDRGVRVVAKVYGPAAVPGLETVVQPEPGRIFSLWPGQQLTLVRDAEEHLIGLLADDLTSVLQAVWSNSLYLSCMHHNHVAAEIVSTAMGAAGWGAGTDAAGPSITDISLLASSPPGLAKLTARTSRAIQGTAILRQETEPC
jgi:sugar-specific transcriptional regulator TrmB